MLSATMKNALEYMKANGGKIYRYRGGFWAKEGWQLPEPYFGTKTISALESRHLIAFTKWQEGRDYRFPVEATLLDDSQSLEPK